MEHAFWHARWAEGRIGFHQDRVNTYLSQYWPLLGLTEDAEVLVPLCGKSGDMLWLREQGHPVLGVELSKTACESFFAENGAVPDVGSNADYQQYSRDGVRLLCGDFFALSEEMLQGVGAVYDRAALIALPPAMRADYARLLCAKLPAGVAVLLVTLEFDGSEGPPFSVAEAEVNALFGERFEIARMAACDGEDQRREVAYLLRDKV